MIFSISSFNKALGLILLFSLLAGSTVGAQTTGDTVEVSAPVAGRAGAPGSPSGEITVVDASGRTLVRSADHYRGAFLHAVSPLPEPLVAGSVSVVWSVTSRGGRTLSYQFELEKDGVFQTVVSTKADPSLVWTPESAGTYRARAIATDQSGAQRVGSWSDPLHVSPPLVVQTPQADVSLPQMAHSRAIQWSSAASGGAGDHTYVFELEEAGRRSSRVATGNLSSWSWYPNTAGSYRIRAGVEDSRGNRVFSPWSATFRIAKRLQASLQDVLPDVQTTAALNRIPLQLEADGGVGALSYLLLVEKNGEMLPAVPIENSVDVHWTPEETGRYRLGLLVSDELKNQAVSPWTRTFEVAPPLQAYIDLQKPADSGLVLWAASVTGGTGSLQYEFFKRHDLGEAFPVPGDGGSSLMWQPENPGSHQVKVVVTDESGGRAESAWSEPYEIAQPLSIEGPYPDLDERKLELGQKVLWSVESSGGVGKKTYSFFLQKDNEVPQIVQRGETPVFDWTADDAGRFKVRVLVEDSAGHQLESPWSPVIEAASGLLLNTLVASPASPHRALSGAVRWSLDFIGAEGPIDFVFTLVKNGKVVVEQAGTEPEWSWYPRTPGIYRVRVSVTDEAGRVLGTEWSGDYRITPAIDKDALFAVLPTENLSGVKAPLAYIRNVFVGEMSNSQYHLLGEPELQDFLRENRVRYTGGLGAKTGKALREKTATDAVFVLSVETYQESGPPKITLHARLIMCRERPEIAWMDSVGLTGDQNPGMLGLGLIDNDRVLIDRAVTQLISSFVDYLENDKQTGHENLTEADEEAEPPAPKGGKRLLPRSYYRSAALDFAGIQSVAVLPFSNRYAQKNSGKVLPLHVIKQLLEYENLNVIEPGLIREALLKFRIVMAGGPSLAVAELMASERVLDADLMIAGTVFDYQGMRGEPKVHFSVQAVETQSREIVWWSSSDAAGNDDVLLFDAGRVFTAHGLTEQLTESIVSLLVED